MDPTCIVEKSADDLLALFVKEGRCVNNFCVLGFGTVGLFDMEIRLVLGDAWRFVLESHEGLEYVFKHGDVDSTSHVISSQYSCQGIVGHPIHVSTCSAC